MKFKILLFCLIPTLAFAGPRYLFLGVKQSASKTTTTAVNTITKTVFLDKADLVWTNLPLWCEKVDTNVLWNFVCVDKTKDGSAIPKLTATADSISSAKDAAISLSNKNDVVILEGDDVSVLSKAGYMFISNEPESKVDDGKIE
jgi:hypothetical protein